jgi:hypothetical protein
MQTVYLNHALKDKLNNSIICNSGQPWGVKISTQGVEKINSCIRDCNKKGRVGKKKGNEKK